MRNGRAERHAKWSIWATARRTEPWMANRRWIDFWYLPDQVEAAKARMGLDDSNKKHKARSRTARKRGVTTVVRCSFGISRI